MSKFLKFYNLQEAAHSTSNKLANLAIEKTQYLVAKVDATTGLVEKQFFSDLLPAERTYNRVFQSAEEGLFAIWLFTPQGEILYHYEHENSLGSIEKNTEIQDKLLESAFSAWILN